MRGSTNNLLDDIERAVDDGINVYRALLKDDRFIPGAGASEIVNIINKYFILDVINKIARIS